MPLTSAPRILQELQSTSRELVQAQARLQRLLLEPEVSLGLDEASQQRLASARERRDALRRRMGAAALAWMMRGGDVVAVVPE